VCVRVSAYCSWNYENLLRQYVKADETLRTSGDVRLIDVVMSDHIVVYEPLWSAIPANKAILRVLWNMYPNHKNLLRTETSLTPELQVC
jgi:glutathionylspermidine synthase